MMAVMAELVPLDLLAVLVPLVHVVSMVLRAPLDLLDVLGQPDQEV